MFRLLFLYSRALTPSHSFSIPHIRWFGSVPFTVVYSEHNGMSLTQYVHTEHFNNLQFEILNTPK